MSEIIVVKDLVKKYGDITAVNGISFEVQEGSLFAFLGPNGAGKSTTINIISTLLSKNAGAVRVAGFQLGKQDKQIRETICSVFQENVLDDMLSVQENLLLRAGMYGKSKQQAADRLVVVAELMGIRDILKRRFGKLSGGQKRRVEIARALMSDPKILILDEPTTGLDPQTRISVWETIQKLQRELKLTVFLTTHYMEEAANADMVAIIDYGKIVAYDTPKNLKAKYSSDTLKLVPKDMDSTIETLTQMGLKPVKNGDMLQISTKNSLAAYELLKQIEGKFLAFEVQTSSMDAMFINITGHAIRDAE